MQGGNRGTRSGLSDRRVPITHASHIQTRGLKGEQMTSEIYGLSAGECYANYDQQSHCLKTLEGFLPLLDENEKGNSLMGFCRTFTPAGMMRNGRLYRLRKSALRIKGSGYGLLPTQQSRDFRSGQAERIGRAGKQNNLNDYVKLWPTPKASDYKGSGPLGSKSQIHDVKKKNLKGCVMQENGGQLNPTWVEWLQGFPLEWTDLKAAVTPLSLIV